MPLRLGWMPNPRAAFARLVGALSRRLDRPERGARNLRIRGAVVTLALGAALPASARLRPALAIFAVACLIDAGLTALLALARLGL